MIVETDFLGHWKTRMLVDVLNDPAAPLCLISLWSHCQQRKTDTFEELSPEALKAICRWSGEAVAFRDALAACKWIDITGRGIFVRGWSVANAKLIANWKNGPKGGRPKNPDKAPADPALPAQEPPSLPAVASETSRLTIGQACAQAHNAGIPEDFARWVFDDWDSREHKDGANVKTTFIALAKKRWNREQGEWIAGTHRGKNPQKAGGTQPKRVASDRARGIPPSSE